MTNAHSAAATPQQPVPATDAQRRLAAFCSPAGGEVFHPIVYHQQIWTPDPLDVETIHAGAREVFGRLLNRASTQPPPSSGRVLLLLGVSGSGKTHLMRAFRSCTHGAERGYFGYMQMAAHVSNYARYVLSNVIDSLDQPYLSPDVQTSALMRLSLGLLEALPEVTAEEREQFREGYVPDLPERVERYADNIIIDSRYANCDLDLIRALLYLQRDDPRIKSRVLKWLRCEDLAPADRKPLGDLVPRPREEAPLRMVADLGKLMGAVQGMALVLCADQLEEVFDQKNAAEQFRRAIDTLVTVADAVPSAVVVISCLEDYFHANSQHLMKPKLDRLELDPAPMRLTSQRTLEEVEALVAKRLRFLYEELDVPGDEHSPTSPFSRAHLAPLAGMRTRDVLDFCHHHRQKCIAAGQWLQPERPGSPGGPLPAPPIPPNIVLEQAWNDFHASFSGRVLDDEAGLAELLAWAIRQCSEEMPEGFFFSTEADGRKVRTEVHGPGNAVAPLLVAACNKAAQGGWLGKQIIEAEKEAADFPLVLVRSTAFPSNPNTNIAKQIAAVIRRGGRRAVVEDSDWRTMLAFRAFQSQHGKQPDFAAWVRESQPLSKLASLRTILALDDLLRLRPAAEPPAPAPKPKPATTIPAPAPSVTPADPHSLVLGERAGLTPGAVTLAAEELTLHMAFLGGTGSGKTTAALNLIEQLLERSIPAVLLDRKGDLCRYADPAAWQRPLADPREAERRQRLRQRLDVAVFTPGQREGRPLTIPVVPEGTEQLSTLEREQLAGYAAGALGSMIGYKSRTDQSRSAILRKAIEVLAASPGAVTVQRLRQLVEERDDALLSAVGGFDARQYKKLAEELLTLWLQRKDLLDPDAEQLDVDALLGLGKHARPGKTRLSVISTRFLADAATTDFWVAQLLAAVGRWIGKRPSKELQAVFLFDEADQYLPAQRQPATKAPMENLLRRARSAGVGVFLATQSPGDFDYKCRDNVGTWLVGRVKEQTALTKLRPMLSEFKADVAAKLPGQETGHFFLLRPKEVCALRARPSLVTTEQVPEHRILELARAGRAATAPTG
jgi:hypothetical protein